MSTSKFCQVIQLVTAALLSLAALPVLAASPVDTHGALAVKGNTIVDKTGKPTALAGPSLFWSTSGWLQERYYTPATVSFFKNQWHASIIRAAIGVDGPGAYIQDTEANLRRLYTVVDAAIKEGIYVIVDWHSHHAEDNPDQAIAFFEKVAKKYGHTPNVIYEIYNEPLEKTDWTKTVKPYAEKVIPAIRAIDPDNLIVVGTPVWSQDVDVAAKNPIKNVKNLAYTLHFYAASHKQALRDKAQQALDAGLPLMVTEWGTVDASGNGAVDKEETLKWVAFMKQHHLTNCNWAISDKAESAAYFVPGTKPDGKWTDADFTESALLVKSIMQNWDKP